MLSLAISPAIPNLHLSIKRLVRHLAPVSLFLRLHLGPRRVVFFLELAVRVRANAALHAGALFEKHNVLAGTVNTGKVEEVGNTYVMTVDAVIDITLLPLTTGIESSQERYCNELILCGFVLVLKVALVALGAGPS